MYFLVWSAQRILIFNLTCIISNFNFQQSSTSSLLLPSHELQAMQEAFKNDDSKIISSLDNTDEPLSFKPRRRASVASFAPAQEELRKSFQEELNKNSSESYCCVPNWAKKDADKLLDLLNMPED